LGDCHDKALELVARRPHFRRELDQKLARRGFSRDEIESTLEALSPTGLVDDLAHARDLAVGPLARKDFGPRRVRAELMRRGVEEEVAERVVSGVFSEPEEELRRAREAARKRSGASAMDDSRLGRYLDRKGYSKSVILRILEEIDPA
jgi:regulatory protein